MIPSRLIFVWIGKVLPISTQLAIHSAYLNDSAQEILLVQEGLDENQTSIKELKKHTNLKIYKFDESWIDDVPHNQKTKDIFKTLSRPESRSNIIRMISLWRWGGIYLDTDTVTLKDLNLLRLNESFCGKEPVLFPFILKKKPWTLQWIWVFILFSFRFVATHIPLGYLFFLPLQKLCYQKVNNAILGSVSHSDFLQKYFDYIVSIPKKKWTRRFYFGTYALQEVIKSKDLKTKVYPSRFFYPLGPEICHHWFRRCVFWKSIISSDCLLVHWYQSVEKRFLKQPINKEWIQKNPKAPFSKWFKLYSSPSSIFDD